MSGEKTQNTAGLQKLDGKILDRGLVDSTSLYNQAMKKGNPVNYKLQKNENALNEVTKGGLQDGSKMKFEPNSVKSSMMSPKDFFKRQKHYFKEINIHGNHFI